MCKKISILGNFRLANRIRNTIYCVVKGIHVSTRESTRTLFNTYNQQLTNDYKQ